MKVGFIGLGNVGAKLAGSLLRNGIDLTVRDLNQTLVDEFVAKGAKSVESPKAMLQKVDVLITCLPSPAASAAVMEGEDGALEAFTAGKVWAEMSTTDAEEIVRLAEKVHQKGGMAIECPVSGGCHRAASGNIAILAGGSRAAFDVMLPLLTKMGRQILHTGELGSASILKVVTNYLATANLVAVSEALTTCKAADLDMNVAYEAIRISSGNSFVHETESQVILNGSRDINFTMDLVSKDIGLFHKVAQKHNVPLELSPLLIDIFKDGEARYGGRELSPNIIKRLEDATGLSVLGKDFPAEITDDEPEVEGYEVTVL
jgi:3-hydroxyisobutyrate dehydrogenase